jgi:hypothetical protein
MLPRVGLDQASPQARDPACRAACLDRMGYLIRLFVQVPGSPLIDH